jgi:DNA-binding NarL/FixJ family response regulator
MTDVETPAAGAVIRRLAILDDHILVLDGLAKWVQVNAPDFEIVVAAGSWAELLENLSQQPDVVIMAQKLDDPVSVQARIRACLEAGSKVVIMSTIDSAEIRNESLEAGASAFVSKARPAAEVLSAARWALDSDTPCLPADEGENQGGDGDSEVGEAELAILKLYSNGYSTVDIALIQGVKFEAVRSALKRIREMYRAQGRQAATRDDLLRRAAEDGYLA